MEREIGFLCAVLAVVPAVLLGASAARAEPKCGPPGWAQIPSAEEMAAVYPDKARHDGVEGLAVLRCTAKASGIIGDCVVESENPPQHGFGEAALKLSVLIRANPPCRGAPETRPHGARIPIRFKMPPQGPLRDAVFQPTTGKFAQYAWLAPAGPYWPEAALLMDIGGTAVVDCHVEADRRLTGCRVVSDTAPREMFAYAVLKMAERGWMTAADAPAGFLSPDGVWRFKVEFPARSLCDEPAYPGKRTRCPRRAK
jgi:TonB family protein